MASTILSDELINPTELRNNQKKWFTKAYARPVSIKSGEKNLVLLNRDDAKFMYSLTHYAEMIMKYYRETHSGKNKVSTVFPWLKHLNDKEISEFTNELFSYFENALNNKSWVSFEEMLDSWIATAEAKTDPEMVDLLTTDIRKEKFTRIE